MIEHRMKRLALLYVCVTKRCCGWRGARSGDGAGADGGGNPAKHADDRVKTP
jgi:hypothetical protein